MTGAAGTLSITTAALYYVTNEASLFSSKGRQKATVARAKYCMSQDGDEEGEA